MVSSGVVWWCYKDNQWIPLQLSAIRMQGVPTQAQWEFVSKLVQKVSNQQLVLQENALWEFSNQKQEKTIDAQEQSADDVVKEHTKELQTNIESLVAPVNPIIKTSPIKLENVVLEDGLFKSIKEPCRRYSLSQIPETPVKQNGVRRNSISDVPNRGTSGSTRKISQESDEIVLRLLKKYCKYAGDDVIDQSLLQAINNSGTNTLDSSNSNSVSSSMVKQQRTRKMSYLPTLEKLYENCDEVLSLKHIVDSGAGCGTTLENLRNEHVLRWLKQQHGEEAFSYDANRIGSTKISKSTGSSSDNSRKSSVVSSVDESHTTSSRKSSLSSPVSTTSGSRKSSFGTDPVRKCSVVSMSSCSENEDTIGSSASGQWTKMLKRHLNGGTKNLEKRIRKQREAWARNTRKLSSSSESSRVSASSQLEHYE